MERVAGGGPKWDPWTVDEARHQLRQQLMVAEAAALALPSRVLGDRLIFQATLLPNYIAASWFPERLFEEADIVVLGSRPAMAPYVTEHHRADDAPTKSLILAGTAQSLPTLDRIAADDNPSRATYRLQEGFQRLHEIRLPSPGDVVKTAPEQAGRVLYEAVMHPSWDSEHAAVVPISNHDFGKWVEYVAALGGEVVGRYRRSVGGLTFVPVYLNADRVSDAALFNPLRTLRPMPQLRPIPVELRSLPGRALPPPPADLTPEAEDRVAVFDGGWASGCAYTSACTVLHDVTSEPSHPGLVEHGSAVTGAAVFGLFDATRPLPRPPFWVDHYRVLPVPAAEHDQDLNWVLDRIVETVRAGSHQVVNLSIGPFLAIDDDEPHRWTAELDKLAAEKDVLFVVAAGNNGDADAANGLARIQVPGDMANGLTVGACDASQGAWGRAFYSAIGPGRQGARVKPTGLAFGGDGDGNPYIGIGRSGVWYEGNGTSFAAPLVTHAVGSLLPYVDASATAVNFLRAMAIHFAEVPEPALPIEEVGYGRLRPDLRSELTCDSDSVTVLYEDSIRRGESIGLLLPFPADVRTGMIALSWTLVITSPVNPADAAEYTLAGVELAFRPHARRLPFTSPDGARSVVVNLDTHAAQASTLLRAGYKPAVNPATRSGNRVRITEQMRRDEGKWESIIHARDRMRAGSILRPRIDLTYYSRLEGMLRDEGVPDLDFVLVVSMSGAPNLYDRVRAQYGVLTPIDLRLLPRLRL